MLSISAWSTRLHAEGVCLPKDLKAWFVAGKSNQAFHPTSLPGAGEGIGTAALESVKTGYFILAPCLKLRTSTVLLPSLTR